MPEAATLPSPESVQLTSSQAEAIGVEMPTYVNLGEVPAVPTAETWQAHQVEEELGETAVDGAQTGGELANLSASERARARDEAGENPYDGLSYSDIKDKLVELREIGDKFKEQYKNGEQIDDEAYDAFDEDQWLVREELWRQGLDENRIYDEIDYDEAQARNQSARQQAQQATPGSNPAQNPTSQTPSPNATQNPTPTPSPTSQTPNQPAKPKKNDPPVVVPPPTVEADALDGPQQEENLQPVILAEDKTDALTDRIHTRDREAQHPTREISSRDRELLNELVQIDENYGDDAILSEGLHGLRSAIETDAVDPESVRQMTERAEANADAKATNGDEVGALRQRRIARNLRELSEHTSDGAVDQILTAA